MRQEIILFALLAGKRFREKIKEKRTKNANRTKSLTFYVLLTALVTIVGGLMSMHFMLQTSKEEVVRTFLSGLQEQEPSNVLKYVKAKDSRMMIDEDSIKPYSRFCRSTHQPMKK
ncbi:hypothetical protein [Thalassobacillus sp. C254]|uniref:hypothetical protein n=1 Tax=Thalassobacillus sp. C254 TaxID=1225341 RepID=UPI0006D06C83|nr:hypothetical protein [Thalassobacillus sp. C254]